MIHLAHEIAAFLFLACYVVLIVVGAALIIRDLRHIFNRFIS
jgi:hypothetical protein